MKTVLQLFVALIFTQVILAQVSNFEGIQFSDEKPPDPVIAVSNDYIVQAVNRKLAVFNKSGTKLFEQSFLGCQEPLLDRKRNNIRKYWLAVKVVLLEKKHSDNLFSGV